LLESPTGTGKTLSLLCASLAWQQSYKALLQAIAASKNNPAAAVDAISSLLLQATGSSSADVTDFKVPKIIYASRTHSQLVQVQRELQKTAYRSVTSVTLGSREQGCVNPQLVSLKGSALNERCRALVNLRRCSYYRNTEPFMNSHPNALSTMADIEDIVSHGRSDHFCPYFFTRKAHFQAELIFLPYNYLVDPNSRDSLDIDFEGSVLIFDEAHNLEGVCADSASTELSSSTVALCIAEMDDLISRGNESDVLLGHATLKKFFLDLERSMFSLGEVTRKDGMTKDGTYMKEILGSAGVRTADLPSFTETLNGAIKLLAEEDDNPRPVFAMKQFADLLSLVFSVPEAELRDHYKVYFNRDETDRNRRSGGFIIHLWCFFPGVAFRRLAALKPRCIVLTSGTLSPMSSFASELGIPFPIRLEGEHVVGHSQVLFGVWGRGPQGGALTSAFQHRSSETTRSELGNTIVNVCRIVPDGILVFFPSYKLLSDTLEAWKSSEVWSRIERLKKPFVEPRAAGELAYMQEAYESQLLQNSSTGAILFAVCRGKVSEGLDFSDYHGRCVIVTGIPFAPHFDPQVRLKREYMDRQSKKPGDGAVINGGEWYKQQASRAVNQAIGRVIRHSEDYGAILLCDERFGQRDMQMQLSKWLQPRLNVFGSFGEGNKALISFFKNLPLELKSKGDKIRLTEASTVGERRKKRSYADFSAFSDGGNFEEWKDKNAPPGRWSDAPSLKDRSLYEPKTNSSSSSSYSSQHVSLAIEARDSRGGPPGRPKSLWEVMKARSTRPSPAAESSQPSPSAVAERPSLSAMLRQQQPSTEETAHSTSTSTSTPISQRRLPLPTPPSLSAPSLPLTPTSPVPSKMSAREYLQVMKQLLSSDDYKQFQATLLNFKNGATTLDAVLTCLEGKVDRPEKMPILAGFASFVPSERTAVFESMVARKAQALATSEPMVGAAEPTALTASKPPSQPPLQTAAVSLDLVTGRPKVIRRQSSSAANSIALPQSMLRRKDSSSPARPEGTSEVEGEGAVKAPTCPVCHELLQNMPALSGRCGHILHEQCWKDCLEVRQECPICRQVTRERHLTRLFF
jgi:regulator of telomere elongation helicase 1